MAALLHQEQKLRLQLQSFYNEAVAANVELQEKKLLLVEQYVLLKNQFFVKSSEKFQLPPKSPTDKKRKKREKSAARNRAIGTPISRLSNETWS